MSFRTPKAESSSPPIPTLAHYRSLCLIRNFERLILEHFGTGRLRGTTHTYLGQEAIAVAAMHFVRPGDAMLSNHRSHGHYLAHTGDADGLLAEIVGLERGVCRGLGGSQHLHRENFFSNGILGGMVPASVGLGLAEKLKGNGNLSMCFLGDGMLGEGIVYESFNMASLWNVPVLFVIENNRFAQTTPIEKNLAGSIAARAAAFGIETCEVESNDIGELLTTFDFAFAHVRATGRPFCQVVHTYRMGPHSKGDDPRSVEELAAWADRDPLLLARRYLSASAADAIAREVEDELGQLFHKIVFMQNAETGTGASPAQDCPWNGMRVTYESALYGGKKQKVVHHLNGILRNLLETRDDVMILGEDVEDPYGGAFKVTKGLSDRFGGRVRSTPISEAGFVGVAGGLALGGYRPIVEIMFGDFTTLIVDQVVNHLTKFDRMYGGGVPCPVIVRVPMGGYRGYGPTHSQSLEKIFLGIPGLSVVACDNIHDQKAIWNSMIAGEQTYLYVENKILYAQDMRICADGRIEHFYVETHPAPFPVSCLQLDPSRAADVALVTYGGMVSLSLDAARALFESDELIVRVIVVTQISPMDPELLRVALGGCRRVVTVEEGTRRGGWGAEVGTLLLEILDAPPALRRVAARDTIIPGAAEPERSVLPSLEDCLSAVRGVLDAV